MSRTGQIQKILSPSFTVKFIPANGDCFYCCISDALHGSSVKSLRQIASDCLNQETFDMMRICWTAQQSG
ncbi:hypothetical protein TrLO_g11708 [Triparma laevis f. longispina]|uniref:OTU domain-containing protein n=1 Tax=Triparma laevis f. longispina TaxID=1714387 RepID=A0A9W7C0W4_9STRA|nr:hypothetical protein TrLO_g11708 [Triparma laevis f. longispina]